MTEKIEYMDRTLICCACGAPFTFAVGEQRFFDVQGFNDPRRCKRCRTAKRAEREQATKGMADRRAQGTSGQRAIAVGEARAE